MSLRTHATALGSGHVQEVCLNLHSAFLVFSPMLASSFQTLLSSDLAACMLTVRVIVKFHK